MNGISADLDAAATLTGTETLTNKTLTNPKLNAIRDTNGAMSAEIIANASAANYLVFVNRAAGDAPYITADGPDANIDLSLFAKGTGAFSWYQPSGSQVACNANGPAADISWNFNPKGAGKLRASNVEVATISDTQTLTNKTVNLSSNTLSGTTAQFNTALSDNDFATVAGAETLTNKTLGAPIISVYDANLNIYDIDDGSRSCQILISPSQTGFITHTLPPVASTLASLAGTETFTNKTVTGLNTTDGIAAVNLPNGITNGNTALQSQVVVSGTSYYITGSNLNLPATLKSGMVVGTRFRWRVAMAKTAAGTGAFAIEIRRGTNGTTADTADVSQSVGTQTAVVDSMTVDVEMVVTTTGATGAYYWTIVPIHSAATATGFGVATGATGQFSGTVSSVALNTASLKFGLSFKATTGTPTITVPLVQASAININ